MRATTASLVAVTLLVAASAWGLGLDAITGADANGGLKDALLQGASRAVGQLGAPDGFLGNPQVRIPLPGSLKKVEKGLRFMGRGAQADELVTSMNHAAELAVQEARPVLVDAVRKMSVQDAKGILAGDDTAATEYFRRTTSATLMKKFAPIVQKATARVQLAEKYNALAAEGAKLGIVKPEDATIDAYVTRKALDGLFLVIGEEEKKIRQDPAGAATSLARKVFGALGQ